ncbi:MAG: Homoserine O-acetyltransferase [Syntrophaceae bacterium PtaU1.Bin231]|nr:MAG: Homoserine O-acetyltransferase [Syntrophaceae bacterium PtaB.Bin038]OPY87480.1 MAG: Homoserine O-acetyltransferase [Syntrophaceae bacterium PtaU1.Bin231]
MSVSVAGNQTADDGCIGVVETQYYTFAHPPNELKLECGKSLGPVTLAYETYGRLNADKSNAILVVHALSGDAHAAGVHKGENNPGWWDDMIGPGKAFDTDRYFVVCSNVIGGCKGSTGPASINPGTGRPYALDFPMITVGDMVNAQRHLIDHLGIRKLLSVAGGSMGGMQVLQWVASYPERVKSAIPIATALKHSPQQIAFNEVVRQSIMADPDWRQGDYYEHGQPAKGLSVARMIGHITFMSDQSMEEKFSRKLKNGDYSFKFGADFEVEGYLRYRGESFVKRFDANSYLYITKAVDYFDLSGGKMVSRDRPIDTRFLVISFKSDWLYPTHQSQEIVRQLKAGLIEATSCEIAATYGHDAFLVEIDEQTHLIRHFLEKTYYGNGTLESGI